MSKIRSKPVTFVGEVSINVLNLADAIAFYEEIIGFRVLEKTESKAVLTTDGKTPLLTLERKPEDVTPKEGRTSGLYHFALLLPTRADLSVFLRHLLSHPISFRSGGSRGKRSTIHYSSRWKWD